MLQFDPLKLAIVLSTTVLFLFLIYRTLNKSDRAAAYLPIFGFFLYSGIASALKDVPDYLVWSYSVFVAVFFFALFLGLGFFRKLFSRSAVALEDALAALQSPRVASWIILAFVFFNLLRLLFPEFRLHLLFAPPMPDIKAWFAARFESEPGGVRKFLQYPIIFLTPFFYIALFALREQVWKVCLLVFGLLYVSYVDAGYLGRGSLVFALIFVALYVWFLRPDRRVVTLLIALGVGPTLIFGFYLYTFLRLGVSADKVDFATALGAVFLSEFSFLAHTGVPLLESGETVDWQRYVLWLVTLPIPGVFKQGLDLALVNYEISEIVLNKSVGDRGFYVVLPGLLAEAYFIYGSLAFWVHAAFLGMLLAFYRVVVGAGEAGTSVFLYVLMIYFYTLNRAGVGAALPLLFNEFFLLFVYIFLRVVRYR